MVHPSGGTRLKNYTGDAKPAPPSPSLNVGYGFQREETQVIHLNEGEGRRSTRGRETWFFSSLGAKERGLGFLGPPWLP